MNDNLDSVEIPASHNTTDRDITFKGFAEGTVETLRFYRSHGDKMTPAGAISLIGMKAAFPERFSNEQLLQNQNFIFYNCLVWLGVEVNDAVDINPKAREEGKQEMVERIFDG